MKLQMSIFKYKEAYIHPRLHCGNDTASFSVHPVRTKWPLFPENVNGVIEPVLTAMSDGE